MPRETRLPSTAHHSGLRDWVQIHLVVLAWGFTGPLGRLLTLPAVEVVVWRTALAAVGLAVLARVMRAPLRLPLGAACKLVGNGLFVGLHWMLFFLAVKLGNVSVAMAALPTTMLWCALLEPLFQKGRRVSRLEVGMGLVMMAAVGLIFRVEFSLWQGFTAGLASAFAGALFAVINKHVMAREHFAVVSCYQMLGACLASLVALPAFVEGGIWFHPPAPLDWLWLLVLSLVCTVGAYAAYMDVLRRLSVFSINVVYNLEPVYGIVLAAVLFGDTEHMSGGFYMGTGIVLAAVIALPWIQRMRGVRGTKDRS